MQCQMEICNLHLHMTMGQQTNSSFKTTGLISPKFSHNSTFKGPRYSIIKCSQIMMWFTDFVWLKPLQSFGPRNKWWYVTEVLGV
jgi:hypothetical protein